MNGFEQIKSFYSWVFNNPDKVKPTHISLYLFLLNQNNRAMWVEWFKCPFDLAMQGSCIGSKSTYYKSLKELQGFGLINYREGVNNYKAPLINLICLYKNEPLTEQASVPLSEPQTEQLSEPLSVLLSGNIYKHITNNIKLINSNETKILDFINSLNKTDCKFEILPEETKNNIFLNELLVSEMWLETTAMQSRKFNVEEVKEKLHDFTNLINVQLDQKVNKKDYASHFVSWLNKQEKNGNSKQIIQSEEFKQLTANIRASGLH